MGAGAAPRARLRLASVIAALPIAALPLALPLAACTDPAPPATNPDPAGCPASAGLVDDLGPPTTVLLVSVDTVHRDFLGVHAPPWDTTPRLDALMAEGARLDHVLVPRGLSGPSMASLITGAYPRTHGVRVNESGFDPEGVSADTPTLGQRFADAGYTTYGYSANQCYLLDEEMETECTWADPSLDQAEGDALLVTELLAALQARDATQPVFAWLHLLDPHDPYTPREPWFTAFHPDSYDGPYAGDMDASILAHMRGTLAYTDADRAYVEAVYASQLAATDAQIGALLDGLAAMGRLDDAVVAFAIDHGDELARRNTYFYHGCSPYDGVLDVTYALWGPGRVPAEHVQAARVSSVDLAPTLAELAGLAWSGPGEGRSLLSELRTCAEPDRLAFFERGNETAGVVAGGWKFFLDPNAGFAECKYFDEDTPYPNAAEELYELDADPLELDDRAAAEPARAAELRAEVCAWVNAAEWVGGGADDNALVAACAGGPTARPGL